MFVDRVVLAIKTIERLEILDFVKAQLLLKCFLDITTLAYEITKHVKLY